MATIKTNLAYTMKYVLIAFVVCLCAAFEKGFFSYVSYGKYVCISAVICGVLSLCARNAPACAVSGVCGLFLDFFTLSLPYFSLLYLYISLGCVWCENFYTSLKAKTVFLICFFVFFILASVMKAFDMLVLGSFFISWEMILEVLLFALVNSALSPIVFAVLKRLKL